MASEQQNNYVLGRGKVYFDKYADNINMGLTGERYLGNTPALNMTSAYQNLDHYSSDFGIRIKDDSVTLQLDRAGNFQCDNITMDNVALMFGSTGPIDESQTAATAQTEDLTVNQGLYYQLGVDDVTPDGVGEIATVTVKTSGGTPVTIVATDNWEVDLGRGRIHIFDGAPDIEDGDTITVQYDVVAGTRTLVVDEGNEVMGALRFIADNPHGINKDYYWPRVKLTPSGDYALKGDTWQTMTFNMDVLIKGTFKRVYVREVLPPAVP